MSPNSVSHTAAVLHGAQDIRIESIETPALGENEVQIAPRATGLCGTDLHYYENGKNGMFVVDSPLVLGHEASGELIKVGSNVTSLSAGDRVVIEPQRPCQTCKQCRNGLYNLCPKLKFTGSASAKPPVQGTLQSLYNHPSGFVYPIPESVSYEEAALVEPLSVALHAVRRSNLRAGQSVLVVGAGAIGLLIAICARISGASSIGMVDIQQSRLDFAKTHGYADYTVAVPMSGLDGESKTDFAARVARELVSSHSQFKQADIAFECTGVEVCANVCLHSAAPRGKVVIVGMGAPHQALNIGIAAVREVDIISVWRYANTFEMAVDLVATKKIDLRPFVTHKYSLEKAKDALELVKARPEDLIKCVIVSE